MTFLHGVFVAFGVAVLVLGLQGLLYFPLTVVYELWKRRALRALPPFAGRTTVVVPAYQEAKTIRESVLSILESRASGLEVVVVDDGSTDGTADAVQDLADQGRIRLVRQPNAGKARALNAGIAVATGEAIVYTDADSVFLPETIPLLVRWFADPRIDAVCGNDEPLRPATALQKLLVVTTHIGTGFVRRALSVLRCLPIVSGNLGAVRRRVLEEIGGFEPVLGEDLEITFRLHRHGKRIVFDPEPRVLAECPATLGALWRQRLRWVRSYLATCFRYPDLFFRRRAWPFSLYLPVNFASMAVVPLVQAALLVMLPVATSRRWISFRGPLDALAWLGLGFFLAVAVYSILLDRAPRDLRYLPHALFIVPLSYFYDAVVIRSWSLEVAGAEERWDKLERRPVPRRASARRLLALAGASAVALLVAAGVVGLGREGVGAPLAAGGLASLLGPAARPAFRLGLSTHFDAFADWRDAIRAVEDEPVARRAEAIGVGAGRPEWVYFRWAGHEDAWSNHQRGEREKDLLAEATRAFHAMGLEVAAFVDLFGPSWLKAHPDAVAVRADGTRSAEQPSLAELADGEWGRRAVEMVEYLAANYAVDAIDLTEMAYRDVSFGPADLASFRKASGRRDWPRDSRGRVDVEHPQVWAWKCAQIERFVARAAAAARRHGKRLYVDVAASWTDLSRDGRDHGHDYRRLLALADRVVVWDYFALEGIAPGASGDLARGLAARFPASHFDLSIGLWGRGGATVGAGELEAALGAALRGGATRVWVTPIDAMTDEHWKGIARLLREGAGPAAPGPRGPRPLRAAPAVPPVVEKGP